MELSLDTAAVDRRPCWLLLLCCANYVLVKTVCVCAAWLFSIKGTSRHLDFSFSNVDKEITQGPKVQEND